MLKHLSLALALLLHVAAARAASAAAPPSTNGLSMKTVNTPRDFPVVASLDQWQARAKEIREQILVSCGLWPMPEKTPVHARIFGKVERDGYSVEKVYFQTLPGFYLAGNLYRPLGRGKGPFPAILNPHGHWKEGRLVDTNECSIPARCISFARQGMIAFSYDMVGFNDTRFANSPTNVPFYDVHRQFGTNRSDQLWAISPMGLQLWNSIRALDFLESLPDADRKRLACTGESGGGTQTFMLGAVDDRLAAQAPVVMVSHIMQGGCSCENAPGLRVEYSNMEIAAAAAPRPQILVAATGDWTKTTLTFEGPAIERIYQLYGAPEKFHYVRFDFGHNYNQTSREAVYEWFGKWLLKTSDAGECKEAPYQKEPDFDLRVFPNVELPKDAVTQEQMILGLKRLHREQWRSLVPQNQAGLEKFKELMLPAWRHTLQVDWPAQSGQIQIEDSDEYGDFAFSLLKIKRDGDEVVLGSYWARPGLNTNPQPTLVVLAGAEKPPGVPDTNLTVDKRMRPAGLALKLLQRGIAVLVVDGLMSKEPPDQFANFYTTYNRTLLQQRARDLVTFSDPRAKRPFRVVLLGRGRAGLCALLAAPAADAVIADCDQLDATSDEALLAPDLFCPGIRNIGGFEGAAMLAAPHPLLLHNAASNFPATGVNSAYKACGGSKRLRIESTRLGDDALAQWVSEL